MRRGGTWYIVLSDEALQDFANEAKRLRASVEAYEAQHGGPDHYNFAELYPNLNNLCERVTIIDQNRNKGG